jgi:hypothetical protein
VDTQLVELEGRNWLTSQLLKAGLEVARPERDKGIDLIVYRDIDETHQFLAYPIQMKAATRAVFSLYPKYEKFSNLILAYVWNLGDSTRTKCFALTYAQALGIADQIDPCDSYGNCIFSSISYVRSNPDQSLYFGDEFSVSRIDIYGSQHDVRLYRMVIRFSCPLCSGGGLFQVVGNVTGTYFVTVTETFTVVETVGNSTVTIQSPLSTSVSVETRAFELLSRRR